MKRIQLALAVLAMGIAASCSRQDAEKPQANTPVGALNPQRTQPAEHWESLGGGSRVELKHDNTFYLTVAGLPDVAGKYSIDGNIITTISTTGEPHRWRIDEEGHLNVPLPTGATLAFKPRK